MITYLLEQLGSVSWGEWAGMWGKADFRFGHSELRWPWDISLDMFCEQLDMWLDIWGSLDMFCEQLDMWLDIWGSKGGADEIELEREIAQRNNSKINASN